MSSAVHQFKSFEEFRLQCNLKTCIPIFFIASSVIRHSLLHAPAGIAVQTPDVLKKKIDFCKLIL